MQLCTSAILILSPRDFLRYFFIHVQLCACVCVYVWGGKVSPVRCAFLTLEPSRQTHT